MGSILAPAFSSSLSCSPATFAIPNEGDLSPLAASAISAPHGSVGRNLDAAFASTVTKLVTADELLDAGLITAGDRAEIKARLFAATRHRDVMAKKLLSAPARDEPLRVRARLSTDAEADSMRRDGDASLRPGWRAQQTGTHEGPSPLAAARSVEATAEDASECLRRRLAIETSPHCAEEESSGSCAPRYYKLADLTTSKLLGAGFLATRDLVASSSGVARAWRTASCSAVRSLAVLPLAQASDKQLLLRLVRQFPRLASVDFAGVSAETAVACARWLPALTRLSLDGCLALSDDAVESILECCPLLTDVNFTRCRRLTSRSVRLLAARTGASRLFPPGPSRSIAMPTVCCSPRFLRASRRVGADRSGRFAVPQNRRRWCGCTCSLLPKSRVALHRMLYRHQQQRGCFCDPKLPPAHKTRHCVVLVAERWRS